MTWSDSPIGSGMEVSTDGLTVTRPTDGGGPLSVIARGSEGRSKGKRYYEIELSSTSTSYRSGAIDSDSGLDVTLGSIATQFAWWPYYGYVDWTTESADEYREVMGDNYRTGISVFGFLVDFDNKTITVYEDGTEIVVEPFPFGTDMQLFPAAAIGVGGSAILTTAEPFQYPPAVTYVAWSKPDSALASKVSGTMKIDSAPVKRTLKAFSYERLTYSIDGETITESKPLGQTISDESDGSYEIILRDGFPRAVFVVAFDDYGQPFQADATVNVGDRIHPTTPNGYVYDCNGSGTLPSTEPTWSQDTENSQLVGTASFLPALFYEPMVHGPVIPETYIEVFTPRTLFAAGEQGAWYDPSDLTTLFQDSAGTIPVTSDGDPVGLMLDKSGNGNHASQSTSAARPTYRTNGTLHWLEFDGIDDVLVVGYSVISGTEYMMSAASMTGEIGSKTGVLFATSTHQGDSQVLYADPRAADAPVARVGRDASDSPIFLRRSSQMVLGSAEIATVVMQSASSSTAYLDGVAVATSSDSSASRDDSSFRIGMYGSVSSPIAFYGGVAVNRYVSDSERASTESYLADQAGVTL